MDLRHGTLLTGNLEDYRVCGLGDVGEIHVEFLPGGFENARGGGVGIGELCTLAPAATIANAVYDATGWRPKQIPLRPDRVLEGVRS
jgi:xanthine dehydrogenase YagR molybdenum-binding subunit